MYRCLPGYVTACAWVVLACAITLAPVAASTPLSVAAFNVQIFGQSFISSQLNVDTLSKVIRRYDIILIQEIRDVAQTAIHFMHAKVNQDEGTPVYNLTVGERVGRSSSKEQYAIFYKGGRVRLEKAYQFADTSDVFEREPYVAVMTDMQASATFSLICIHTKPDDAPAEIDALISVYEDSIARASTYNSIILGDFNADCSYVGVAAMKKLRLLTDQRFRWFINDTVDTTTSSTDCAYDRFVLAGAIRYTVVAGSADVFRFDTAYSLSPSEALQVSDHYPIEMQFVPVADPAAPSESESGGPNTGTIIGSSVSVVAGVAVVAAVVLYRKKKVCFARRSPSADPDTDSESAIPMQVPPTLPPREPAGDLSDWQQYTTDTGDPYYFNEKTGESRWELPS